MNRFFTVVFVVLGLTMATPALSQSKSSDQGTRFELMGGVGLNACMDDGKGYGDCDDLSSSYMLLIAPGVRFTNLVGAYLDVAYGALSPDTSEMKDGVDASFSTLAVMPTVRFFGQVESVEFFGGLGVGYSRLSTKAEYKGETATEVWSNVLNFKIGAGVLFKLTRQFALGLNIDYVLNTNDAGEICLDYPGEEKECNDISDLETGDMLDLLQVAGVVRVTF